MPKPMLYMGHAESMHSNKHFYPKMSSSGTTMFTFKMYCLTMFSILWNFIVIEFLKTVINVKEKVYLVHKCNTNLVHRIECVNSLNNK